MVCCWSCRWRSRLPGSRRTARLGAAASGEAILLEPQPQPWGGSSDTALVVGAGDITPPSNTVTWDTSTSMATGVGVFQTSPSTVSWWYQFHVPSGALLQRVEMAACDNSTTAGLNVTVARGIAPAGMAADITPVGHDRDRGHARLRVFHGDPHRHDDDQQRGQRLLDLFQLGGSGFGPPSTSIRSGSTTACR